MQDPRRLWTRPKQNLLSHKQSTTFLQWSTYYSLDAHLSSDDNTAMLPNRVALHYVNIIINSSDSDVRIGHYFSTIYHHCLTPRIPSQWLKTVSLYHLFIVVNKSTFLLSNSRRYTQYKDWKCTYNAILRQVRPLNLGHFTDGHSI